MHSIVGDYKNTSIQLNSNKY